MYDSSIVYKLDTGQVLSKIKDLIYLNPLHFDSDVRSSTCIAGKVCFCFARPILPADLWHLFDTAATPPSLQNHSFQRQRHRHC